MSSPFSIFRRHQRILMVVLTGLAMVSFVLLGAVQDPREMPAILVILALAAMVGGAGWVAGLARGKASEWGTTGLIAGIALGLAIQWYNREPNVIVMSGSSLTRQQVAQIRREREMANYFVERAFAGSGERSQVDYFMTLPRFKFGITTQNEVPLREVALDAILRREADRMGIVISDEAVRDFITELTGGKLTGELFREIRNQLQASEAQLIGALQNEMKAREAANVLFGPNVVPPEAYWDFYTKLHVKQSAEVATVPVSAFVDEQAQPSDAELQELFVKYRENLPNFTPEGRPEEGRPGFLQPRRVRLAYLEAVYEEIERLVGEVSDADIQKRYEERYLRTLPSNDSTLPQTGSPALPPLPEPVTPSSSPNSEAAAPPSPPAPVPAPDSPAEEKSSTPPDSAPSSPSSENAQESSSPTTPTDDSPSREQPEQPNETSPMLRRPPTPTAMLPLRRHNRPTHHPRQRLLWRAKHLTPRLQGNPLPLKRLPRSRIIAVLPRSRPRRPLQVDLLPWTTS